jgi:hypothetical protein
LEPREFYTVNSRVPGRGGRRGKRPSWRLTFHFAEVQGRIACVRLEIAADPGDPRPITASLLRRLPMTGCSPIIGREPTRSCATSSRCGTGC